MNYQTLDVQPSAPYKSPASEPRKWEPVITNWLMGIAIAIYLIQLSTYYLFGADYPASLGMKVNNLIIQGQLWRLIAPVFLHGSIFHIGFNMYALHVLGPGLERFFGKQRFLALFLLAGFTGNVASFMFSQSPSLGASTAIFGLLAAQGVFLYQNKELIGNKARREITNVVMIALINLFIGLTPGIDNWGHLGGLLGGAMFTWFAGPYFRYQDLSIPVKLEDQRSLSDALRAGLLVFILFSIPVAYKILTS